MTLRMKVMTDFQSEYFKLLEDTYPKPDHKG